MTLHNLKILLLLGLCPFDAKKTQIHALSVKSGCAFLKGPKSGPGMIKWAFSATYVLEGGAELGGEKKIARPEPPLWNCILSFLYYFEIVFCYIWPVELYFPTVNHCGIVFSYLKQTCDPPTLLEGMHDTLVDLYSDSFYSTKRMNLNGARIINALLMPYRHNPNSGSFFHFQSKAQCILCSSILESNAC